MKKLAILFALLLMALMPSALSAADHIVFIHGWQMTSSDEVDTFDYMIDCMTNTAYGTPYCSADKVLVVQHAALNSSIDSVAENVWSQITEGFPDGQKMPKMDFVVHSMGGLILRSMVAQGLLQESLVDHVVTLASPHYGQRMKYSEQQRNMAYGSEFLWDLANAKIKINPSKILCLVATEDQVVNEWAAALVDDECRAVRYVSKSHSLGNGICRCGAGYRWWNKTPSRQDPVYQLVTSFCKNGTISGGGGVGTVNEGAILFQIVDGKDAAVSYDKNKLVKNVKDVNGDDQYFTTLSPERSSTRGIGAVYGDRYALFEENGLPVGSHSLEIVASKGSTFSEFTTDPIEVKRGRTTVVTIHAENVKPLDFLFLIDSTGSMSGDIDSVKASAQQLIRQKLGDGARNCRVAVADYRDYPESPYGASGDYVFNPRCNFTTNAATAINALNAITVGGGGDGDEAVLSALYGAMTRLQWNDDATKTIMLMGDAGPHDPEPWSGGHSSSEVLSLAKERGIKIYPMLTGYNSYLATTYESYASETGGKIVSSSSYSSAAEAVQEVIEQSVAANGFETDTVNVSETGGSVTIRVYGGNSSAFASVGYQIVAGTAVNGKDYSATASGKRLNWTAGERCYKSITIPILKDATSSSDKFFSVVLNDPENMGLGGINVCRINVIDQYSTGTPAGNRIYVQGLSRQSAGGSVSGSGSYVLGAMVTLKATAASGYVFTSWEDGSTSPTRTIDSNAARAMAVNGVATYVASFMKLSDLPLPEVTSPTSVSAKVGEAFNWSLDYYSPSAATVTCAGLPSGFTVANGIVSGSAASPGTWTATFTVSNAKGSVKTSVTFTFEANPVFSGANGVVSGFVPNGATEVVVPRGVTAIGEGAFSGCATITSVSVPPTVTLIGKRAFSRCSGLAVISLPRTLEGRIDPSVFAGCPESLTIRYYDVATVTFDAMGGNLDNPVQNFAVGEPFGELPELHENRWKFLGWRTAVETGDYISNDTIVSGDAIYYASWEADMESVDIGFRDVEGWEQPFCLSSATNGLEHITKFEFGDPIYMRYAFMNVAGFAALNNFVVRFTLNSSSYFDDEWGHLDEGGWGWSGLEYRPVPLQNLPIGKYTLTCSLDAEDFVSETDEGNNEISLMFEVVPSTKPNLKIDVASVSKQSITLSESAIVHWRMDNDGASAAGKTQTAFQIWKYDSSAENWILKKTEWLACNPLASGAGRESTRTVTGKSLGAGKYIFRVWTDGKDAVREKNESDNYADTYSLTVEKDNAVKSSSGVDWQFRKYKSSEPDSFYLSTSATAKKKATVFKAGQTIYMRCCWWNATKKAASGDMRVRVLLNGRPGIYTDRSYFNKNSWYYFTDRTPDFLQNLPAGKYTLTTVLDSENNWTEKNEKNNIKRISFTVVEAPVIYGEEAYTCALREPVSWPVSSEGTVTVKGLPPGLKYSGGAIAGKATKTGTFTVKFTSKNAAGTKTKTIKITVVDPGFNVDVTVRANGATEGMSIASGGTIPMYTGVKQNIAIVSEPGKSGIAKSAASSVTVKGLPAGLKYSKGVISGVPAKEGTYTVKLAFKNALGWSKTFTVKMAVKTLPAFARGTFNGWTYCSIGEALGKVSQVRKATISVTKAGKITATVGSLKFTGTGWTVEADEDGLYWADLRTVRTVGSGKKAKKYTDILSIWLDPTIEWTADQFAGRVATFGGAVSLANALSALEGENALSPSNEDTYVLARRNPFGDNTDAKEIAAVLAAQGTRTFTDESGLVWNVKMSSNGVATISRTTGSGKNKKTVSASAVLEVDSDAGGNLTGATRFTVSGKVIAIPW